MHTFNAPHFNDDNKAREYLENLRWPNGLVCPHCGSVEGAYALEGKAHRPGLRKCAACREQFSVTVGTVFERSKIGLSKWLLAVHLLCSSKKGISSHQIHRTLGVTYKTAWFMTHRIRLAMDSNGGLLGSGGGIVEADETYIGRKPGMKKGRGGFGHKNTVLALVERDGKVKSTHITGKSFFNVKKAFKKNMDKTANLMTDEHKKFRKIGQNYASHETVNHGAKEYARGNVNTNTIEGVFSIFKRGMIGTYQHCDAKHLHRYLAEFDFRYNNRVALEVNDKQRADNALAGIGGKRLTYRPVGEKEALA
jgi:transposase-like protein